MSRAFKVLFIILFFFNSLSGQEILINDIVIDGNKVTKKQIILRELPFSVGDVVSEKDLKDQIEISEQNLLNTGLFNDVNITPIKTFKNDLIVLIELKELWYIFPSPIFSLVDPNFNLWWRTKDLSRVNYGLSYLQKNFRGRNERLSVKVQGGYSQKYVLSYQIPGINNKRTLGLLLSANYSQFSEVTVGTLNNYRVFYDDKSGRTMESTGYRVGLDHRPRFNLWHRIYIGRASFLISDSLFNRFPDHLNNKKKLSYCDLYYIINYQNVDFLPYPLKGSEISFETNVKGIGAGSEDLFTNFFFNFSQHTKLADRWHFQIGLRTKYSFYKELPYALQRGLGYSDRQVRGFGYYIIDGQAYSLFRNNLKFTLIKPNSFRLPIRNEKMNTIKYAFYLNGFFDAGYVKDDLYSANNILDNKWLLGSGIGLDFVTAFNRVFRLEYSINNINERGLFLQYRRSI